MSEWVEYKLTELGTLKRGKSKHRPRYAFHLYGGIYPFIQTGDVKSARKYITSFEQTYSEAGLQQSKLWPKGTLCITIAANIAEVAILDFEACFPDSILGFIPNKELANNDFIYYTLCYHKKSLQEQAIGSVQDNLNATSFENFAFAIPPLQEQKAIASVLSSLDDKIDLLHRQNQTLEAMAETLFRQWFVEEAGEDWEEVKLGELLVLKGGTTPSTEKPEYWDGKVNWSTPKDLTSNNGPFIFQTERKITELGLQKISSGLLPIGTLLLSSRAPIGYLAITQIPLAINQGYIAIQGIRPITNTFMYFWCKANMETIENAGNGSVFQEISKSTFKELTLKVPSIIKLEQFEKAIEGYMDKIKNNCIQIQTLTTLRDTLLPKLMSGEVRVKIS